MINGMELFASVKVSKTDGSLYKSDFSSRPADAGNNFRSTLREAARNINGDDNSGIRKELTGRAESKLKKPDKQQPAADEITVAEKESEENRTEKLTNRIDEVLMTLQQLVNLQQNGELTPENRTSLQEGIEAALQELAELQSKLAALAEAKLQTEIPGLQQAVGELKAFLEGILNELEADDGSSGKGILPELMQKLEAGIEETMPKLEAQKNTSAENIDYSAASAKTDNTAEAAAADVNDSDKPVEADRQVKIEVKTEAQGTEKNTLKKAAGTGTEASESDIPEEEKAALEGKTGKAAVESREGKNQNSESGAGKEAAGEGNTAAAKTNKPVNQDMAGITQGQPAAEANSEAITDQVEAPRTQTVSRAEIIDQIVKKAEIIHTGAQSEMRMQLEPENLGKLTLRIAVERGLITAKFTAESYEVKQVIESSFNELRDMLQEKGLEVQNFSVSVGQDNKEYNNGNAFQQWKETVRLTGAGRNKGGYEGYMSAETADRKVINPYIVHNGEFDHIA